MDTSRGMRAIHARNENFPGGNDAVSNNPDRMARNRSRSESARCFEVDVM